MSLDVSFHVIYGYKTAGHKIEHSIAEHSSNEPEWIMPNGKDFDEELDDLRSGANGLILVDDPMCGEYSILGIPILNDNSYTYDTFIYSYSKNDIVKSLDDEKLDEKIREVLPYFVGKEYDDAGLLYGQLPEVYIVKEVY